MDCISKLLYWYNRLSEEKLLKDYLDLKAKVESQQRLIDQQNEMLDEAQELMQQLKVG